MKDLDVILESIVEDFDARYDPDAYHFVMEALNYTQKRFSAPKHVTSAEVLQGVRELLLRKYGPLTITVLKHWGIHTTEDVGNIIFNLVENHVLTKTTEDNIDQFRNGFDFDEVFTEGYRKQLHKRVSRMK
ncbi:MAG: putative repeat protein (TIGR04138 family) [Candidatus Omnitrophota bacterium]|jgi:uncharacterized repeat protein (TIGR04138 family)